jgi:hypothetical protein
MREEWGMFVLTMSCFRSWMQVRLLLLQMGKSAGMTWWLGEGARLGLLFWGARSGSWSCDLLILETMDHLSESYTAVLKLMDLLKSLLSLEIESVC